MIHHHDVGVDEVLDEGRGESVAFYIDAGFIANFAVGVVEFEVAENGAVVGAGEVFGDGRVLGEFGRNGTDGVKAEGLLGLIDFGVARPLTTFATKGEA